MHSTKTTTLFTSKKAYADVQGLLQGKRLLSRASLANKTAPTQRQSTSTFGQEASQSNKSTVIRGCQQISSINVQYIRCQTRVQHLKRPNPRSLASLPKGLSLLARLRLRLGGNLASMYVAATIYSLFLDALHIRPEVSNTELLLAAMRVSVARHKSKLRHKQST